MVMVLTAIVALSNMNHVYIFEIYSMRKSLHPCLIARLFLVPIHTESSSTGTRI